MRVRVTSPADTLTFHDMGFGQQGAGWLTDAGVTGWFGAVKPREEGVDIPQQDGCYMPARLTSAGRTVTVNGAVVARSSVEAAAWRDRINDLAGRRLTLTVEDASGERGAVCWLADDPEPSMWVRGDVFTFALVLYCPDPLKYGAETVFGPAGSGSLTVSNDGLAASWPRVRVDGRVSGLRLSCGDGVVEWRGDADGLDLDFRDMLPGAGAVSVNRPWRVPPGVSTVHVTVSQGARVSMMVRPAWR